MAEEILTELPSKTPKKLLDFQADSLIDETVPQIGEVNDLQSQYVMEPCVNHFKPTEKISQNAEKSLRPLPAVPLIKEQQYRYLETSEMTTSWCRLKLRHNRYHPNRMNFYAVMYIINTRSSATITTTFLTHYYYLLALL